MITKEERAWIENQIAVNNMTGDAARTFTEQTIDYFRKRNTTPSKPKMEPTDWSGVLTMLQSNQRSNDKIRRIK